MVHDDGKTLELRRLGATPKLGVKGPGAAAWLRDQGIAIPAEILEAVPLADDGWVVRGGTTEFFLESPSKSEIFERVSEQLQSAPAGVYLAPRSDETICLIGPGAYDVFAQTCGVDLRKAALQKI